MHEFFSEEKTKSFQILRTKKINKEGIFDELKRSTVLPSKGKQQLLANRKEMSPSTLSLSETSLSNKLS